MIRPVPQDGVRYTSCVANSVRPAEGTFISLFSGMGGFDLSGERTGWRCLLQVELDKDCRSLLRHRWPDVESIDDVGRFRAMLEPKNAKRCRAAWTIRPDLICGGFPCQDLSVAGRRAGLAGSRSGLWFVFRRIVALLHPRWVLIENVPGLLSSNRGRDMGTILRSLGQLGYGWAYRCLDAQHFGVPQRRNRVFIVGCLGSTARAAAVLFESVSGEWNPAQGGEARQETAGPLGGGTAGRGWSDDTDRAGAFVAGTMPASDGGPSDMTPIIAARGGAGRRPPGRPGSPQRGDETLVTGSLQSHAKRHGNAMGTQQAAESGQLVAHTLRSEGADASEDGTGRGVPLVAATLRSRQHGEDDANLVVETADDIRSSMGVSGQGDRRSRPGTDQEVLQNHGSDGRGGAQVFESRIGRNGRGQPGDICPALKGSQAGETSDMRPLVFNPHRTLQPDGSVAEGFKPDDTVDALHGPTGNKEPLIGGVRRLTPRECERLQGFPGDWTRFGADGKELSDSARYRLCGNAVAVPVVEWIMRRMREVSR